MITKTQNYKPVKNLLSKGSTNSKTAKNSLETFILYLAPERQNSKRVNLCPKASKGCHILNILSESSKDRGGL